MFKITEGVVATLMLAGLDEPPAAEGFSTELANSYFAHEGVDVSLTWIDAKVHAKMMQQHRDNLEVPTLVTVDRITEFDLGGVPVTGVVYYKSRPVVDPDNPEAIIEGREATWQYIWPGDAGQSHALLTIWRSGSEDSPVLEDGFADMRERWTAGAALPGRLYDLRSDIEGDRLILTGVAVEPTQVDWGEINAPLFHGYEDWQVVVTPPEGSDVTVTKPVVFQVMGLSGDMPLEDEVAQVEAWVDVWSPVFAAFGPHVDNAGDAFRQAVAAQDDKAEPNGPLSLFDAVMDEESGEMRLVFVIDLPDGDTHEGWVRLNPKGEVTARQVDW